MTIFPRGLIPQLSLEKLQKLSSVVSLLKGDFLFAAEAVDCIWVTLSEQPPLLRTKGKTYLSAHATARAAIWGGCDSESAQWVVPFQIQYGEYLVVYEYCRQRCLIGGGGYEYSRNSVFSELYDILRTSKFINQRKRSLLILSYRLFFKLIATQQNVRSLTE